MLWGFGCLSDGQNGGPMEELSLPMAARTLCWRSGLWAKASWNMCLDGIVTAAMHAFGGGKWNVKDSSRNKALGAPPAANENPC